MSRALGCRKPPAWLLPVNTNFDWTGATAHNVAFYYRTHILAILAALDHQPPIDTRHLFGCRAPIRHRTNTVGDFAERKRLRQEPAAAALRPAPQL